ncbi:MAG TPA: phosphatidate cytidylyltransferase [Armatimonadota bacterium]|nr:phosphatidate cytidylyltransferase [Armatimonadota bacterium]
MLLRWITAGLGIPLFVGICVWGIEPFALGILCVAAIGLAEIVKAYHTNGVRPNPLLALLGLLAPSWVLAHDVGVDRVYPLLIVAMGLLALIWEVMIAAETGVLNAGRNVGSGLLCALYVALFGGLTALRGWPGRAAGGLIPTLSTGFALVIVTVCSVWATDSAALFIGRWLGRRKLAPLVSPGKTLEGAVGGLAGGLGIGALFGWIFLGAPLLGLAIGAIAGVLGQMGDLFESVLKREAGVKDFGVLFPGHGGVLDRFDSLLFTAPFVWILVTIWK